MGDVPITTAIPESQQPDAVGLARRLENVMATFASSIEVLQRALHGNSDAVTGQYLADRVLALSEKYDRVLDEFSRHDKELVETRGMVVDLNHRVDRAAKAFGELQRHVQQMQGKSVASTSATM